MSAAPSPGMAASASEAAASSSGAAAPSSGTAGPASRAGIGAPPAEIETRGLRKRYGRRDALRDVDLAVERGGFLTVFGPNGAGKTTLLRILAGLASATEGTVNVAGADVREDPAPCGAPSASSATTRCCTRT